MLFFFIFFWCLLFWFLCFFFICLFFFLFFYYPSFLLSSSLFSLFLANPFQTTIIFGCCPIFLSLFIYSFGIFFLMFLLFCSGVTCCCFENQVCVCFFFYFVHFGGLKGQVRWPEGPPLLALNPLYFFCFFGFVPKDNQNISPYKQDIVVFLLKVCLDFLLSSSFLSSVFVYVYYCSFFLFLFLSFLVVILSLFLVLLFFAYFFLVCWNNANIT